MKRKKMELNKKLFLNKETITNLTPGQQSEFMGGAKPDTHAACGTASLWKTLCICPVTKGGDCSYGTVCCPMRSLELPCVAL